MISINILDVQKAEKKTWKIIIKKIKKKSWNAQKWTIDALKKLSKDLLFVMS